MNVFAKKDIIRNLMEVVNIVTLKIMKIIIFMEESAFIVIQMKITKYQFMVNAHAKKILY